MLLTPRKANERHIHTFLKYHLSSKYCVKYKPFYLKLKDSEIQIDFYVSLKKKHLPDKDRPIEFFIQIVSEPTCAHILKIYDLILSYSSIIVLWDYMDIEETLLPLVNILNSIADQKNVTSVFSPNLLFLMFCDQQDAIEAENFHQYMCDFSDQIKHIEKNNGIESTTDETIKDGEEDCDCEEE